MKHSWLSTRVRHARTTPSRDASAVEWVIITAIIAGVALSLAAVIRSAVETRQNDITTLVNED